MKTAQSQLVPFLFCFFFLFYFYFVFFRCFRYGSSSWRRWNEEAACALCDELRQKSFVRVTATRPSQLGRNPRIDPIILATVLLHALSLSIYIYIYIYVYHTYILYTYIGTGMYVWMYLYVFMMYQQAPAQCLEQTWRDISTVMEYSVWRNGLFLLLYSFCVELKCYICPRRVLCHVQ